MDFRVFFSSLIMNRINKQEFRVDAIHFHEEYNVGLPLNNDIAVVRVKASLRTGRGFRFGERVVPACLPHANVVYGPHLNCTVYGWGSTGAQQPGFSRYKVAPGRQGAVRPKIVHIRILQEGDEEREEDKMRPLSFLTRSARGSEEGEREER